MEKDVIKIEREQLEALVFLVARFEENIKRLAKAAGSVHDSMQELNDL